MIQIQQTIEIHRPLQEVLRLFTQRDLFPQWQPGLVSSEVAEGELVQQYNLIFQFGRRRMAMTETILNDNLPVLYEVEYRMKGVINRVTSSFEDTGEGSTRWTCTNVFQFKGVMKLASIFMGGDFEKQSSIIMNNFKGFAESYRQN